MKSKIKRRMLALVLCMVIVLSNSSFIFASGGSGEVVSQEDGQQTQDSQNGEDASGIAAQAETRAADATPTPTPDATPEPTPTATPEPTPTATPEPTPTAAPEPTPTAAPEVTPAETSEPTTTPEPTTEPQVTEQPTTQPSGENDPTPTPTAGPTTDGQTTPADPENGNGQNGNGGSGIGTALVPTETPAKSNEAVELKKEFKDSNGKVTATVTAKIPAGAFEADASEITMEVKTPKQADVKHLTKMMEESLPEHHMLGDYILYDIQFKVNGTAAEARQPIVITFEGNGISVKDVKRANVFRFDAADPEVAGDKDELVAITQKSDMLEYLQNSAQSTENIDDYDLSEISLKEDGTSDKIQMEGRTSTIYGCYVVYEPVQVLTYEDEQVVVTVSAQEDGVIPANAELKVVPITAEDVETKEQYVEVEKKLQEKAEEEAYDIAGFLAYDITFVDPDGNKIEPNGEVKVTMEYKEAVIADQAVETVENTDELESTADLNVTVLHLEEDEKGEVKEVVDMVQNEKTDVLSMTEENKVEKVEVRTESFSTFVITWGSSSSKITITAHYVYLDANNNLIKFSDNIVPQEEVKLSKGTNNLEQYKKTLSGYNFVAVRVNNALTGDEIVSLEASSSSGFFGSTYEVGYKKKGGNQKTEWLSTGFGGSKKGDIYFVYTETSSGGSTDTPGGATLGTPEHNKYIKRLEKDKYRLSLDVTGKVGEALPIDILLIIDKSASMAESDSKRYEYVNSAISTLTENLKECETEVNVAVVTFSSEGRDSTSKRDDYYLQQDTSVDAWKSKNWTELENFSFELKSSNCTGGTNWQAGVRKGEEVLAERADVNSRKYVLFLTDGDPTFRYVQGSDTQTQGTGSDDQNGNNYNYAVNEWRQSVNLNSANTVKYVIDATKNGSVTCSNFATAIGAVRVKGSNKDQMVSEFKKIAEGILKPSYDNVYIEDTLSSYVEFVNTDVNSTDLALEVTKITKSADGRSTEEPLGPSQYNVTINGKTIRVDLLDGNALEENVTYRIQYNIKVNETAYSKYVEEGGYTDRGELGTDYPDVPKENWTSSGKDGFYSNEKAVIGYKENGGPEQTAKYKHPVVQIDTGSINIPETPNPIEGSITKTMGTSVDGKYPITLEVKTRLEETSEKAKVDVIFVIDTSASMTNDGATRLSDTKKAAKAFVKGFVGGEGFVSETHRIGIVTFGKTATKRLEFTGNVDTINQSIDRLSASGGTNTADGLQKAKDLAESSNNKKYVIFLTDGVPTYGGDENNTGDGSKCYIGDFNAAVDAANNLAAKVDGIYTVGLLNGMSSNSRQLEVARTLLAAPRDTGHYVPDYTTCHKVESVNLRKGTTNNMESESGTIVWGTEDKTYSDGYFEILETTESDTALQAIWEQLAVMINNSTSGSTGDGWTVTDTLANYTDFQSLVGAEINGYTLELSDDGKSLTTIINNQTVTVAEYSSVTNTIIWTLYSALADQSIRYQHGVDYTYRLTYYVDFEDSGNTELRPTNAATYVAPPGKDPIYPARMPFFVNVVGLKADAENTQTGLQGAEFNIYKDANKNTLLCQVSSGTDGGFSFQLGQTDFTLTQTETGETYTTTVYIEETVSPLGYVSDGVLHAITITVTDVVYVSTGSNPQIGTPSGTVNLQITDTTSNNLLSVVTSDKTVKLQYKNKPKPEWGIVKRNKNNTTVKLSGAEFQLFKIEDEIVARNASYQGVSDQKGIVNKWEDLGTGAEIEIDSKFLPVGEYLLKETKAPLNYTLSDEEWIVTITSAGVSIRLSGQENQTPVSVNDDDKKNLGLKTTDIYFYYDNVMVYELPSTGGSGIFWYLMSGTLFMMAASFILYKTKRKEVLGK